MSRPLGCWLGFAAVVRVHCLSCCRCPCSLESRADFVRWGLPRVLICQWLSFLSSNLDVGDHRGTSHVPSLGLPSEPSKGSLRPLGCQPHVHVPVGRPAGSLCRAGWSLPGFLLPCLLCSPILVLQLSSPLWAPNVCVRSASLGSDAPLAQASLGALLTSPLAPPQACSELTPHCLLGWSRCRCPKDTLSAP